MKKRMPWLVALLVILVIVLVAILISDDAAAHHPEVRGETVCAVRGENLLVVRAEAWRVTNPAQRINNDVRLEWFDGTSWRLITKGAFTAPDYEVIGTTIVPNALGVVKVRATSVAPWGSRGEFGSAGESRETTVKLLPECPAPAVTTPPSASATSTTTTAVTTTTTTTTTRPVATPVTVGPIVESPRPAVPVVTEPKYTG